MVSQHDAGTLRFCIDTRGVATLTLNRPDQHNALNRQAIDELTEALQQLSRQCRILIVAAAGRSFCAGADIAWMRASASLTDAQNRDDAMALSKLLQALDTFPAPTIARVQGAALGGGVGLLCCCDIALAAHTARFALSEVRLGLIPATISPYVLTAIGARQARRFFISAERFDADTALRIGLVHEVLDADADSLDDAVTTTVNALLAGAPQAQLAARTLIRDVAGQTVDLPLRESLADRLATTRAGAEAQEGLAAFIDKRAPEWPAA